MVGIISGREILIKALVASYLMLVLVVLLFLIARNVVSQSDLLFENSASDFLSNELRSVSNGQEALLEKTGIVEGKKIVNGRDLIIVIDAGHGGKDSGAVGPNGLLEKDVSLAIAKKLALLLEKESGFKPVLVRNGDTFISIIDRLRFALNKRADMVVSIHADAFDIRGVQGSSVIYHPKNMLDRTKHIGRLILKELGKISELHSKFIKKQAITVLAAGKIPSIMVEAGFISNPAEAKKLADKTYQNEVARSIFVGIRKHFYEKPSKGTWVAKMAKKIKEKFSRKRNANNISHLLEWPIHF